MKEGKNILLISQQSWGMIHLSKHNYALELARRGNQVFFLSPPQTQVPGGVSILPIAGQERLFEVKYQRFFPLKLRDVSGWLYKILIGIQARRILQKLPVRLDMVWSFDYTVFPDLSVFGTGVRIFHPVDPLHHAREVAIGQTADAIFSVSEKILNRFGELAVPRTFINHGLSQSFAAQARRRLEKQDFTRSPGPIRIGYVGNLLRGAVDQEIFLQMVREQSAAEWHIWGPVRTEGHNLSHQLDEQTEAFITQLEKAPQVILHGTLPPDKLALAIQDIDLFVLSYRFRIDSDRSNSHKLLEYLSTGKVVVSSRIDTYQSQRHLLEMPQEDHDKALPALLEKVVSSIDHYNAPEKQASRLEYVLANTYDQQLDRIFEKLQELQVIPQTSTHHA